jgi:hypothetical protein
MHEALNNLNTRDENSRLVGIPEDAQKDLEGQANKDKANQYKKIAEATGSHYWKDLAEYETDLLMQQQLS